MGHVVSLFRYPLKSARGEQLRAVGVDVEGVRGDRSWACLDDADGTVGRAKHPDRWGRLLGVTAQVDKHSSDVSSMCRVGLPSPGANRPTRWSASTSGVGCG